MCWRRQVGTRIWSRPPRLSWSDGPSRRRRPDPARCRTGRPPRRDRGATACEQEEFRRRNCCRHLPVLSGRDRPVSSQRPTSPRPGVSGHAVRHPVEQDLGHQHVPLLCAKRGGARSGRRGEILRRDLPTKRADFASRTSDHHLGCEGKAAGAPPRAVNPRSGGACSDRVLGSAAGRQWAPRPSVLARRCQKGPSVDGRASRRGSGRRSLNTANPRRVSGLGFPLPSACWSPIRL